MTNHTAVVTDPIARALTYIAQADEHSVEAERLRNLADDATNRATLHALAGRHRERERGCLKRAEVLAQIATAQALADVADSGHTIALAR